jgi:Fur family ferric uptake transcriptional regulator
VDLISKETEPDLESEREQALNEYLRAFNAFLDKQNLRKTVERNMILTVIFEMDTHFTVEKLQKTLKKRKYHVSKSTLYKTVSLLVEAGLISKHYFPSEPSAQYEKNFSVVAHNHVYMEDTNEMFEFSDERINELVKDIEKRYDVKAVRHSFTVYCKKK